MGAWDFASLVTRAAGTSGGNTVSIQSGEPIFVKGIVLANTDASDPGTITIRKAETDENFITTQLPANGIDVIDIPFIADLGLEVVFGGTSPETCSATIFHFHEGT